MSLKANSWSPTIDSDTNWNLTDVTMGTGNDLHEPYTVIVENISQIPMQVKLIAEAEKSNDAVNRTGVIIAAGAQKTFEIGGAESPVSRVGIKLLTGQSGSVTVYVNAIDYRLRVK